MGVGVEPPELTKPACLFLNVLTSEWKNKTKQKKKGNVLYWERGFCLYFCRKYRKAEGYFQIYLKKTKHKNRHDKGRPLKILAIDKKKQTRTKNR